MGESYVRCHEPQSNKFRVAENKAALEINCSRCNCACSSYCVDLCRLLVRLDWLRTKNIMGLAATACSTRCSCRIDILVQPGSLQGKPKPVK